jgi:hypothetical protein
LNDFDLFKGKQQQQSPQQWYRTISVTPDTAVMNVISCCQMTVLRGSTVSNIDLQCGVAKHCKLPSQFFSQKQLVDPVNACPRQQAHCIYNATRD